MLDYPEGKVFKETYLNYEFKECDMDSGNLVLGDIALSLEKAKEQSIEFGHSFLRETCYLTVHSVLHLLGYDHMAENEKKIMRDREEKILKEFNFDL
jgi:probable rRNA maturation factor